MAKDKDTVARIGYYAIYGLFKVIGALPAWFLYYPLAEFIYFVLYYVCRYRVEVTRRNLSDSFPDKSVDELRRIERRYYRHLAEIFVDTIDLTGISKKQLCRRMVIRNEAEHRRETEGRDWIAALAHYGAWEYFMAYALGDAPGSVTIGVYKTLHDRSMDMFYRKVRSRMGLHPVPMSVLLRHMVNCRREGMKMAVGLIADQAPPRFERSYWYDFLGRPTAFFSGMENLALRFGMPVYFVRIEKIRRAHYEAVFECIYDGVEAVRPHEITKRYVAKLDTMIRRRPELWLWSHKRWKHSPTPEELARQQAEDAAAQNDCA